MPTREDLAQRGRRRAVRLRVEAGRELRDARREAGLSQAATGRRAGLSQNKVSRLERGVAPASMDDVAILSTVVGLDMAVRFYPGSTPLRDQGHVRLLARLQALIGPGASWSTEVPLPISGDQRAIDATLRVGAQVVAFELETRLMDAQATARRATLKARDAGAAALILVLADTRWNRSAIAASAPTLRASFPLSPREILAALRARAVPRDDGILVV